MSCYLYPCTDLHSDGFRLKSNEGLMREKNEPECFLFQTDSHHIREESCRTPVKRPPQTHSNTQDKRWKHQLQSLQATSVFTVVPNVKPLKCSPFITIWWQKNCCNQTENHVEHSCFSQKGQNVISKKKKKIKGWVFQRETLEIEFIMYSHSLESLSTLC